jgi:hypothetical protein
MKKNREDKMTRVRLNASKRTKELFSFFVLSNIIDLYDVDKKVFDERKIKEIISSAGKEIYNKFKDTDNFSLYKIYITRSILVYVYDQAVNLRKVKKEAMAISFMDKKVVNVFSEFEEVIRIESALCVKDDIQESVNYHVFIDCSIIKDELKNKASALLYNYGITVVFDYYDEESFKIKDVSDFGQLVYFRK